VTRVVKVVLVVVAVRPLVRVVAVMLGFPGIALAVRVMIIFVWGTSGTALEMSVGPGIG
jgi:hypothetical protein